MDVTLEVVIPGLVALALTVLVAGWVIWQVLNIGRPEQSLLIIVLKAAGVLWLFRAGCFLYLLHGGQSPYSIAGIIAVVISFYPEGALLPNLVRTGFSGAVWQTVAYVGVLMVGSLSIVAAMAGMIVAINSFTMQ